jgi:hypothetical protein
LIIQCHSSATKNNNFARNRANIRTYIGTTGATTMQPISRRYEEKRKYIRMNVDAPARLTTPDGSNLHVTCVDLSSHGVQIEMYELPEFGMEANFTLEPGGGPITPLQARIKFCRIETVDEQTFRAGATIEELV